MPVPTIDAKSFVQIELIDDLPLNGGILMLFFDSTYAGDLEKLKAEESVDEPIEYTAAEPSVTDEDYLSTNKVQFTVEAKGDSVMRIVFFVNNTSPVSKTDLDNGIKLIQQAMETKSLPGMGKKMSLPNETESACTVRLLYEKKVSLEQDKTIDFSFAVKNAMFGSAGTIKLIKN